MECKGQEELCGESGGLNFKREEGPPPVADVQGPCGDIEGGGGLIQFFTPVSVC